MKKTAPKKKQRFYQSKKGRIYILSVILIATALSVYFMTSHLFPNRIALQPETNSYAARPNSNTQPVAVLEGENFSTYSLSGGLQVQSDPTASGGSYMSLANNTTANGSVSIPSSVTKMTVTVRGDRCKGNPNLTVLIDQQQVFNKKIPASSWNDYSEAVNIAAGSHNVAISLTNDYASSTGQGCDRSLDVDKLSFQ